MKLSEAWQFSFNGKIGRFILFLLDLSGKKSSMNFSSSKEILNVVDEEYNIILKKKI